MAGGAFASLTGAVGRSSADPTTSWSVPYVDVTLTPTFQFQDPAANPARTVALAFVVADPERRLHAELGQPTTRSTRRGTDLELDRRIAQLRSAGGDVMVSFGGQANDELAVACTDTGDLTGAYRDVVERYDLTVIDLDIEGAAIADQRRQRPPGRGARRAAARARGRRLARWPSGSPCRWRPAG